MTAIIEGSVTGGGLLDDAALVQRILTHIDEGTTDLADESWREPVEHYRSPARLAAEMELVFRRHPTPFCPSAAVPEPGSFVARDAAGVPIVVVRGNDGLVRAFRNACRHRGTAVASGTGCARSLVCPYHGWVYRLDGALRHVPGEHGFPDLDKDTRGLVPVRAEEHAGVVFVTQDDPPVPGADLSLVPTVITADQVLVGVDEYVIESNWKVFLEGFLEGYHIKATHPETFLPFGYDNLTVWENFGRNTRVVFPFKRIERQRDVPVAERRVDGAATVVYHLFPNVLIGRFTHYTNVFVFEPVAPDRTKTVSYKVTNHGSDPDARAAAERDYDFINQGADEDRAIARAVTRGLGSGANETIEFGRFEGAITRLHRHLDELIDGAERPT